jgi:hypothetical protein
MLDHLPGSRTGNEIVTVIVLHQPATAIPYQRDPATSHPAQTYRHVLGYRIAVDRPLQGAAAVLT